MSRCKICDEGMLFHFDAINRHLYTHKTSLKAYKAAHPAFTGEEVYNQNRKACEKIKRKRKYEFDAACIQKWSCTVGGARKYYSDNIDEMCLRFDFEISYIFIFKIKIKTFKKVCSMIKGINEEKSINC